LKWFITKTERTAREKSNNNHEEREHMQNNENNEKDRESRIRRSKMVACVNIPLLCKGEENKYRKREK
jgi:hypothetical protein